MALIESKFFSRELYRSVSVNVVLPLPDSGDEFFEGATPLPGNGKKYQVLYLLHGFSADQETLPHFRQAGGQVHRRSVDGRLRQLQDRAAES